MICKQRSLSCEISQFLFVLFVVEVQIVVIILMHMKGQWFMPLDRLKWIVFILLQELAQHGTIVALHRLPLANGVIVCIYS